MAIEVMVAGLAIDPANSSPVVLLRSQGSDRVIPIWVGAVEAAAIATELEGVKAPRPMTHDLIKHLIERLGGRTQRIEIVALRENTFYAAVVIENRGETVRIDARPSDAIAIALRARVPIYCDETVFAQASIKPPTREISGNDSSDAPTPIVDLGTAPPQDFLENLDASAFGKYKM